MRTVIAIPCMDMIHTGFVRSLAEMNKPEDTAPFNPIILDRINWQVREDGNVEVDATSYLDYPKDSFFEIAGCGFGCVMTSTKLLSEMVEKYGEPFTPLMGMGEDVTFCWRARQSGYRIFCDSTIKCGHIGHYPVTERDFERVHQSAP